MKRIFAALTVLCLLSAVPFGRVHAQTAQPVPACNVMAYQANGLPMPLTQTPGGALCVNAPVSATASTPSSTTALASSQVLKSSAGALFSFQAVADSTLAPTSTSVWYLMIFDATSAPADGAVTPKKCFQATGASTGGTYGAGGIAFSTGIVEVASTTGCYSKTASAHAFLSGDVQ